MKVVYCHCHWHVIDIVIGHWHWPNTITRWTFSFWLITQLIYGKSRCQLYNKSFIAWSKPVEPLLYTKYYLLNSLSIKFNSIGIATKFYRKNLQYGELRANKVWSSGSLTCSLFRVDPPDSPPFFIFCFKLVPNPYRPAASPYLSFASEDFELPT